MKLPRDVGTAELIKALARIGYRVVRQSGSHIRLQCSEPAHSVTVPNHRPLRVGTLASILSDVASHRQIDKDALIEQLWT
jgi:predicted RNA binding protein YcfA (HicA-like mRNA interferase family)